MISSAADEPLVDLAKHLGVVTELESTESPSFWDPSQPRIFISHLAADKKVAGALKVALEEYGCACFVAHDDIEPTRQWQQEIELALTTMDVMIAVLTPGFIGKFQALPAKGRTVEVVAVEIIELLAEKPQIAFKISNALVERLGKSSSWAEAKKLMGMIEKCRQFSSEALEKLQAAADANSQVRDAWGVPERIKNVVEKASS